MPAPQSPPRALRALLALLNTSLWVVVALVSAHGMNSEPEPLVPSELLRAELASLEQRVHSHPEDAQALASLMRQHVRLEQPGQVLALASAAPAEALEHPEVSFRMAQAYERLGRVHDALALSRLGHDRCARAIGSADGPQGTPVPRFRCSARDYAVLSIQHRALLRMAQLGISSWNDPRRERAHVWAERRARVALR